jgi:hypothetical protein
MEAPREHCALDDPPPDTELEELTACNYTVLSGGEPGDGGVAGDALRLSTFDTYAVANVAGRRHAAQPGGRKRTDPVQMPS